MNGEPRSGTADLLLSTPLFDAPWYAEQVGRPLGRVEAVEHYLAEGAARGLSPHPLFDPAHYAAKLKGRPRDPFLRYLQRRDFGRSTHPLFRTRAYRLAHPEADDHPWGPLGHYDEIGRGRGFPANDWLGSGDLVKWVRERHAEWRARQDRPAVPVTLSPAAATVLLTARTWAATDTAVTALARHTPGADLVVRHDDREVRIAVLLDSLPLRHRVRVVHAAEVSGPESGVVITLPDTVRVLSGWLPLLLAALADPGVGAVQPLVLDECGLVCTAGPVRGADGSTYPLLEGFPPEDAAGIGREVQALDAPIVARPGAPRPGRLLVVPESRVQVSAPVPPPPAEAGRDADEEARWGSTGFLRRGGAVVRDPATRLRWAIKNPAPAGERGERWGDTHFARDLATALRALGQEVVIDAREAFDRPTGRWDDVTVTLRGLQAHRPPPGQTSLLWVISHPELVTRDEVAAFDRVFAASVPWAEARTREWGLPVQPLLQATDPARFHPDLADPDTGEQVLFVGKTRGEYRAIVRDAVAAGLPLAVYGGGWRGLTPESVIRADFLDNAVLGAAYRSAGVVLNDHWEEMRRNGFLSNRLFDAAAAGARVITDDVTGLGDLFGSSVQVYRTVADLRRLALAPDRDVVFGDDAARRAVAARIARDHSFLARARSLLAAALDVRRLHPPA